MHSASLRLGFFRFVVPSLLSSFLILSLASFAPGQTMEAWFLTQYGNSGTQTLIRGPNGKVVLFDAGGGAESAAACKTLLTSLGISKINVAVASHYDADHCGGLDNLVGLMGPANFHAFYDRGGTLTQDGTSIPSDYYNTVAPSGKRSTVTVTGTKDIDLGSGAYLRFLSVGATNTTNSIAIRGRPAVTTGVTENSKSITCLVSFPSTYGAAGFDLYLGGDAEGVTELAVDDAVKTLGRKVDVLLVDHHGADTYNISSPEFLSNMDPEVAIISVWNNSFGHPRKTTVTKLQAVVEPLAQRIIRLSPGNTADPLCAPENMSYCCTTNGTLKITTKGTTYTVSGPGITQAGLVNHAVDEGKSATLFAGLNPRLPVDRGDYDGDGISDISVFRPSDGSWRIHDQGAVFLGRSGDLPVSGDYNGDGISEVAIFRPESGLWSVNGLTQFYFGDAGDIPVPGDYNGDGVTEAGVFRPSQNFWAVRDVSSFYFGADGDIAVPGDYDGDGKTDVAIFRPASTLWAVRGLTRFYFGEPSDLPVPGNYNDADLSWEAAVFRPASGLWAIRGFGSYYLGAGDDQPVPGDYFGDGIDAIGIFRGSDGLWSIPGVTRLYFGGSGDIPATR